jgi:hypothetical protein
MTQKLQYKDYEFTVSAITEQGVVTPVDFDAAAQTDGIVAVSRACVLFDDPNRPYDGLLKLTINDLPDGGLSWHASAETNDLIKGIKVALGSIPGTSVTITGDDPVELEAGRGFAAVFPSGWYTMPRIPLSGIRPTHANGSQHLFIEGADSLWLLSSDDHPPRFQRYWAFREGDQLELTVYLEANVSGREKQLTTPNWTLEPVADYQAGIQKHRDWMTSAYDLAPLAQREDTPEWVQDICLNITFHCHANHGRLNVTFADIERNLEIAARCFEPENTQLHVVGWDGPWDMTWPAFEPGEALGGSDGFHQMMQTVHDLGYKIGLHMNVMGLSYQHPRFDEIEHFLQYQCRDAAGRLLHWEHDLDGDDQDELIFAYISPDAPEWRAYLIEQILQFVKTYRTDIVHLDQSTTLINDQNFDHLRGVNTLFRELRELLPEQVVLSGEYVSESLIHLYPMCGYFPLASPEMQRSLYMPFVRAFDYGMPPEPTTESLLYETFPQRPWRAEAFHENLHRAEAAGLIPTLLIGKPEIDFESPEARAVFEAARRFREQAQ